MIDCHELQILIWLQAILAFQEQHLNTIQLWARSGGRRHVTSSQNKTHLSDLLSDAREARVTLQQSSQRQIRSAEMGLQREKEDTCVITCVCAVLMCLTRNMLTHNRDFGPVQTNQCYATLWCIPGRALLKQPARSRAATGTKAKPRDKSGNPQTKGDVVMHDMLLQNRVSVFYFIVLHEEYEAHRFCKMCFSSQTCNIKAFKKWKGNLRKCTNKTSRWWTA